MASHMSLVTSIWLLWLVDSPETIAYNPIPIEIVDTPLEV